MIAERTLICPICGKTFTSTANVVKYCSKECCNEMTRRRGREKTKAKSMKKNTSLDERIKALNAYNKKHGTNLSYGKFMSLPGVGI